MRAVKVVVIVGGILLGLTAVTAAAQLAVPRSVIAYAGQDGLTHTAGLFDSLFGRARKDVPEAARPEEKRSRSDNNTGETPGEAWRLRNAGTFRTLCVRLCDGFYFPISFATTRNKLREDAKRCERQCPSRSRLYVHSTSRETVEEMTDLEGQPYAKLPTAFRYRTDYVTDCTCRSNPWEAEALARHQAYAAGHAPTQDAVASAPQPKSAERRRRQNAWGYRARQDQWDGD